MKLRKRRILSAFVGLGLGALATATAHSTTRTDVSGKRTVEAEFVALEEGMIALKTSSGKVTLPEVESPFEVKGVAIENR